MKKIKVGYLPLYIKLYDDSDPCLRTPVVEHMKMIIGMLKSQGLEIAVADEVCRVKEEFDRAVKKFNDADVDAVITQHLAYSPSLEAIEALRSLNVPIIVLDTTPDYGIIKASGYENRIMPNHGIHGVQDMCSLLKRTGKAYYLCAGHALHSEVIAEVAGMCRAAAVAKAFKMMHVGSIGGRFAGMGDFVISDARYKSDIGANVRYMTENDVQAHLKEVTEEEIDAELTQNAKQYNVQVANVDAYRLSVRAGLAVRKWMQAENLGSVTINFSALDEYGLPKMPFVECCKILERGQGYAGVGDVLSAGLVGALLHVYPNTAFVEMFCPDWEQNVILLSHMGESNPKLAQWKPLITDCPFNYNSCGDTVAMYNCYRPGNAVYVNLAPMNGHFHLIVSNVKLLDVGLSSGVYACATQGWMKPCKPVSQFLKEFSLAGGTHHSAIIYDADIEEIKAFGQMMNFEVIEIM